MVENNMDEFYWYVGGRMIKEGDIVTMLFSISLKGNAREWWQAIQLPFNYLSNN